MMFKGAASTALGYEAARTGVDLMNNGLEGEHVLSPRFLDSAAAVFENDWGVSLTVTQTVPSKIVEGKFAIPLYNQTFIGYSAKSPAFGSELVKANPTVFPYSKMEVNDAFYLGVDTSSHEFSYGSRQEIDLYKDKIGGFKYAFGVRYSGVNAVPSINVGWEFSTMTSVNLEFRGLKGK